jgi:peptide/nickel transport system permease protein
LKRKPSSLTLLALHKFKKNKIGVLSFWYIVLCGFVAIFAYALAPDNSSNANQMHIEIHTKKPGFKVLMLTISTKNINGFLHVNIFF